MKVCGFVALLMMFVGGHSSAAGPQAVQKQGAGAAAQSPGSPVPTPWARFSVAIDDYVKTRDRVRQELPGLAVTANPAEYLAASDALARAVERANPNARQGRFFSPQTAAEIRRRIADYGRKHDLSEIITPDPDEGGTARNLTIYTRFPMSSPMASMPPGLLAQLPPLPPALEYRLVGRVLILRDTDAALVLDYLPNAVRLAK